MDWDALKVFLAIVRRESLSGAVTDLGVNHSTILGAELLVSNQEFNMSNQLC